MPRFPYARALRFVDKWRDELHPRTFVSRRAGGARRVYGDDGVMGVLFDLRKTRAGDSSVVPDMTDAPTAGAAEALILA